MNLRKTIKIGGKHMKFILTPVDIFYLINGVAVPDNIIPKKMKKHCHNPERLYFLFTREDIRAFQAERVRQEIKVFLFRKFPFLIGWELDERVLKLPGAIAHFFMNYCLKEGNPCFKFNPLPKSIHLSIKPFTELEFRRENWKMMIVHHFYNDNA